MSASPTLNKDRIFSIDAARGFALLGILLVNILGFNASFFNFGGFYSSISDESQMKFYQIFISLTADKFIFLFSFLFGYGIFLQFEKFRKNEVNFNGFFSRRMLVLAIFGFLHVLLLWAGDILISYAIAGFIILALRKLHGRWQILIALIFYFFIGIWLTAGTWITLPNAMSSTCTQCLEQAKVIYREGNYFDCLILRLQEYFAFRNINIFYYLPKIIGIALMGFVASKNKLHKSIEKYKIRWSLIWTLISGAGVFIYFNYEKIVNFDSPFANAVYMCAYEFMNIFVASSYLLFILIIASFKFPQILLKPLANMGRMSLTNYLMQSLIMAFLFQGWGLGLYGQTQISSVILLAIGIFVLQLIINSIWFRFYNQGPLEKIWRKLSYRNN
ncbi:MAG: DUF418 domain-containing protein [Bacteroidales bacterium]|nr:DUF418 domain-containing protein [Bacteroidales bacterium]